MKFSITLSSGSLKEFIDYLKEINEWKEKQAQFIAASGDFKEKCQVKIFRGLTKNHKAGQIPYTETVIEFEKIEDKKEEEEIEKTEEEYTFTKEELTACPLTSPKLRYRKNNE